MKHSCDKSARASSTKESVELAKKSLKEILTKVNDCRLPDRAIHQWRIYSRLRTKESKWSKKYFLFAAAVLLSYYFVNVDKKFVWYKKCLVESPPLTQKLFRPAEDCSVCSDVQEIEKLSNVDVSVFEQRYAYTGRPVIITDGARNWTAMNEFSFSFFKSLYKGKQADCQFFPYKTEFRSLQEVFNMSSDRAVFKAGTKPWYVGWSNCDQTIGAILRKHYSQPYFLPETSENEKTDWIFMGRTEYGAPMHIDDVGYPSWQAQIRGKKKWILEPPRECLYTCSRLEAVVNPGEINTNRWYHQTQIVSSDISITIGAEFD